MPIYVPESSKKKRKVTDTMVLYEWLFPTLQQN